MLTETYTVNHSTNAAPVMQAITQAQFPQASTPLGFSHPSGYQSLNVVPSYPIIFSKTAERIEGQEEEQQQKNTPTKIFKRKLSKERKKRNWKGLLFFPAISLTSF